MNYRSKYVIRWESHSKISIHLSLVFTWYTIRKIWIGTDVETIISQTIWSPHSLFHPRDPQTTEYIPPHHCSTAVISPFPGNTLSLRISYPKYSPCLSCYVCLYTSSSSYISRCPSYIHSTFEYISSAAISITWHHSTEATQYACAEDHGRPS